MSARHAPHTKAISTVWCYRNFNDGIVKSGIGRKWLANRRIGWQVNNAIMLIGYLHFAFGTQHPI